MRFNRITLRDYKAIRNVTIEPRPTGVTILEGENEVGKSSIAEALWLVFDQNDDSSSQLVKGLKPIGRDAATEIEVEVTTGDYRFRYLKRFHRAQRTELEVFEPRHEQLTGREAHNRARQILDETIDRPLWEALRLQQGASLEPLAASQHQPLLNALGLAAGELLGGEREKTLFERIKQEYERYFTAAAGRERASGDGPSAPRLRRTRDDAMGEVQRLTNQIIDFEGRAVRFAALGEELGILSARRKSAEALQKDLAIREEQRKDLRSAAEAAANQVRLLEGVVRELSTALKARTDARKALAQRLESKEAAERALAAGEAPLQEARAAFDSAIVAHQEAIAAFEGAKQSESRADSLVRFAERELQAEQMAERLERLERHAPEIRSLVEWLNACKLDHRAVQEIETADRNLARVEAQREAEGASIDVSAPQATTITIDGRTTEIGPDRSLRGSVPGETTLSLPDGLVVKVRAGKQARELAHTFEEAKRRLEDLLKTKGVESAQQAREIFHERGQKEERRRSLAEQMKSDLRDLSAEDLRAKLDRERAALAEFRSRIAADRPESLDDAKRLVVAVRSAREAAEEALKVAVRNREAARSRIDELERGALQRTERLKAITDEIARAEAELSRLSADEPVEVFEQRLAAATTDLEQESAKRDLAEQALAAAPDVSAELQATLTEISRLEADVQRLNIERAAISGVLEEAGADGLHGRLVEAEQRLAVAEQELEAFERRAAAARTLFEAMKMRRDEAQENYAEPLRKQLESLGKRVLGDSLRIELADDLKIARVSRHGTDLDVSQLSVGLREQLSVLTRLACAALVSENGGAPVVLDDIFGWADPARLEKLGPVLAEAAKETQVLLFTCTPRRFDSVVPARVISLPTGARSDRGERGQPERISVPATPSGTAPRALPRPAPLPSTPQAAFDLFADPEPARRN